MARRLGRHGPDDAFKLADIALQAHPEGFQLAPDGSRAFVNVPDARQIASVDLVAGKQTATWRVPGLESNFPMALDSRGRTLAIAFRGPARLALLDAASGAVIASVDTCGDADDVFFDERRRRIYVVCGAGAVDVFDRNDGGARAHSSGRDTLPARAPVCSCPNSTACLSPPARRRRVLAQRSWCSALHREARVLR